jgi:hypothetical protein
MWAILDLIPKWDKNYSFIQHNYYILITNTLISSLIPTTWVHPNENIKIQQNETVKTTYVPNTIRIPTHGVDFSHQGLRFGERTQNHQWNRRKVSRGEGRKKEREREGSNILPRSHVMVVGAVVPPYMAWLNRRLMDQGYQSCHNSRCNTLTRLRPRGGHIGSGACVCPICHASAHVMTPSWVMPTSLARLRRVRSYKYVLGGFISRNCFLKMPKYKKNQPGISTCRLWVFRCAGMTSNKMPVVSFASCMCHG